MNFEKLLTNIAIRFEVSDSGIIIDTSDHKIPDIPGEGKFILDYFPSKEKPLFMGFLNEVKINKYVKGKRFNPLFLPSGNWIFSGFYNTENLIIFVAPSREKSIGALKDHMGSSLDEVIQSEKNPPPSKKEVILHNRMADLNNRLTHLHNMLSRKNYDLEKRNESLTELTAHLNSVNQELKDENKELLNLSQIISHDLKSPLGIIANATSLIGKKLENANPVDAELEIIRSTTFKMSRMIDSILNFSKMGEGEMTISSFSIADLITDIKEYIHIPAFIDFRVKGYQGELVTGRTPMFHVLVNLVYNSIKHNFREDGYVELNFEDKGEFLQFSVKDNGPGISKARQKELFKFNLKSGSIQNESSGVGLIIVKNLVEKFKGYIVVESGEGEGCTFFILWKKNPNKQELTYIT